MFTRSKQNANEAQLQFRRENPITLCGRIAHTACPQPRTQALWLFTTSLSARGKAREGEKWKIRSIKLIHAAHAKATQAIEQHIAPGYEAGLPDSSDIQPF
jgi:hypothetical protein